MPDLCKHYSVNVEMGGWSLCTDESSPYWNTWIHADPGCMKPKFLNEEGEPMQYVRVEVDEGKTYTYVWEQGPPLEPGEWVRLPRNEVKGKSFPGKVIRVLDGPDPSYVGEYKGVLGRLL